MTENIVVPILEIREEFATCEICLNDFDDGVRAPRILPCIHTFCCECLEKIWTAAEQGVNCPKCRKLWPVQGSIKSSFQQNNMLMHMVEYIGFKKKLGDVLCSQCPDNNKATVRCLECEKYLCETCDRYHARFNETHKPVPLTELVTTPRNFLKTNVVCPVHGDKTVDVYCKSETCEKAMCTTCALVSHKEHDICDLREFCVANKKKISSSLDALKKASESHTEYKSKLEEQNTKLDKMQVQLMNDIEEHSGKLVEKVENISTKLKRLVMENIAKQKVKRDEQIALVDKSEELKAEHVLYCQQALSFARDVEFVEMTKSLEKKGKSLIEDLQVLDLQVQDVSLNTDAYENLEKSIGQLSIHEADSCKPSYEYPNDPLIQSSYSADISPPVGYVSQGPYPDNTKEQVLLDDNLGNRGASIPEAECLEQRPASSNMTSQRKKRRGKKTNKYQTGSDGNRLNSYGGGYGGYGGGYGGYGSAYSGGY